MKDLEKGHQPIPSSTQAELINICSSWISSTFDEVDYSRVKELPVREILSQRAQTLATAQNAHCIKCPTFVKHVS